MRSSIYLFGFVVFFFLTACNQDENIKLGFLYSTNKTERYVKEANYFKEFAESKGYTVYTEHADGDEAKQYQKALELFDKGIDGLAIIAVNANTAAAIVREAHERDISVLAYNRLIKNCELDFFVTGDNDALGKMMVDEMIKVKPSGDAVILGGDKYDRNAVELMESIKKYLQPHVNRGAISINYETFTEEWSGQNAAFELDQYISHSGKVPDLIFAGFDGMADACIQLIDNRNIDKHVYISGQDATLDGAKNIINGKQQMTAFHPLKEAANKAAEAMIQLIVAKKSAKDIATSTVNNGKMDVPVLKIPSVAVTQDNVDKVLIHDSGFYTHDEIYN